MTKSEEEKIRYLAMRAAKLLYDGKSKKIVTSYLIGSGVSKIDAMKIVAYAEEYTKINTPVKKSIINSIK